MRIVLSEFELLEDLSEFLRRCGYEPHAVGPRMLEAVAAGAAPAPSLSAVQIDGYLRTWMLMHPGAHAELVNGSVLADES